MNRKRIFGETIIARYLASVHGLSIILVLSLAFYNAYVLCVLPLLLWIQYGEWQRYYFLNHKSSVTHFSVNDEGVFDLYHFNRELGQWTVRCYFRIGGFLICYFQTKESDIHLLSDHRLRDRQQETTKYQQWKNDFQLKLNSVKSLFSINTWRWQTMCISEAQLGKVDFRYIMRLLIWKRSH